MPKNVPEKIESGLLGVFRLFVLLQWLFFSAGLCLHLIEPPRSIPLFTIILWGHAVLLLGLLSWPWLQRVTGSLFLPLTLVFATLVPISGLHLDQFLRHMGVIYPPQPPDPGNLLLLLLVPLLLISMQYNIWIMLFFILSTSFLDLILTGLEAVLFQFDFSIHLEENLLRTLLFLMIGLVVVRLSTAQRKQRKDLSEKNAALRRYAAAHEQLVLSQERNRMARELHDTLSHTLTALTVQMEAADILLDKDPDRSRRILQQAQEMARDGANETRRALKDLRAQPLEDLGLKQALIQLIDRIRERSTLEIHADLPAELPPLSSEISHNLYRLAEEALQNVLQHARAHSVCLELHTGDTEAQLDIRDDGKGFDPQTREKRHFGLTGMQERTRILNGEIQIRSAPEKGTHIRISIPLHEKSY